SLKLDRARIRAGADDDQFWLVFARQSGEFLVVDDFGILVNAIRNDLVILARKIQRMTVSEMPTVRQIHAENGVAGLQDGEIYRHVGLAAGMGLHVDVLGTEEFFCTIDRKIFHDIHELAATVIPPPRITLRILIRE